VNELAGFCWQKPGVRRTTDSRRPCSADPRAAYPP